MSLYSLASRISSVEFSVDDLSNKGRLVQRRPSWNNNNQRPCLLKRSSGVR